MAVVLFEKDSDEWVYRGEGAVNLVLAYCGKNPKFVGKVLRIHKVATNGSEHDINHLPLTDQECIIWQEYEGIVSAPSREIAEQLYVQKVMCPLLGSEHVDAGIRILVSKEFLESVEQKVLCQRPTWRVHATKVNSMSNSAILISDHSIFPHGTLREEFCVSIEIKPKAGILPYSEYISEENAVKRRVTRFRMHQALKLKEGKISELSKYDPLDMFSGSKERVLSAVKSLFLTPQNNLRVFLNGSLIFGGMDAANSASFSADKPFQDGLQHVILAKHGLHTNYFLELVSETLFKSGLLNRLLDVQKLDALDIEGAIHAYYDIVSEPCIICLEKAQNSSGSYSTLHSMPHEKKLKIVRDYLISATAKDLSMMISFRTRATTNTKSLYNVVFLEPTNQTFDYKVSFIDLDMKPLKKMQYYYELDQKIVKYYLQMKENDNGEAVQHSSHTFIPNHT